MKNSSTQANLLKQFVSSSSSDPDSGHFFLYTE
jgi:hypothetical protein